MTISVSPPGTTAPAHVVAFFPSTIALASAVTIRSTDGSINRQTGEQGRRGRRESTGQDGRGSKERRG